LDCGGFGRLLRCLAIIGTTFAITWGNAFAAPPQESPGSSEHAPGQQKHESDESGRAHVAPGQAKKELELLPTIAPAANGNETHRNTERPPKPKKKKDEPQRSSLAESTRYTNPQGKPKRNVPEVAEAAPTVSASGPGKSGIHKLTLCHNGHAITVDIHAAAAHLRHGDTFLPAGTKGRTSCVAKQTRSHSRSSETVTPSQRKGLSPPGTIPRHPATTPATIPTSVVDGVLGKETTDAVAIRNSVSPAVTTSSAAQLPFTGSAGLRFVVAGLVLIALGCVLMVGRRRLSRVFAAALESRGPPDSTRS
jgi:hypothetical protein